ISEAWYFVPMVISSSLFPAIINAKKVSEELYYARLQKLYDLMVWIAISVALPMTFLSDWVVHILYGNQYNQAGSVLMIHIWGGVNVSMGTAWSRWILNENKQIIATYGHFLGAILNIIFNLYFIKSCGIDGAAYATLLSYFLSALFVYTLYKPKIAYKMFLKSILLWRSVYAKKK
ncbi:MAG: polysaccharide biosynthesis C-terminal domain-containing protein, partial [Candidatus Methanomethylicia archaeon]